MSVLFLLGALSFALSLLLVPLCRNAALRWKLVDYPDLQRKIHRHPIPRVGGVAVFAAITVSTLAAWFIGEDLLGLKPDLFSALLLMAFPALSVFLLGLFDDLAGMKASHKLAGQIAVACIAVAVGIRIDSIAGVALAPWAGAIATVIWLVACANALNLIDGVDGLASGVALIAACASITAALLTGRLDLAIAFAPVVGALLGFLIFNSNPASIFLGDCGSLLLGILLGCHGVLLGNDTGMSRGMLAPAVLLAIPFADVSLAMTRRFLRRQPIFSADRSHIHHRLLALGLTARGVVVVLYGAEMLAGVLALTVGLSRHRWDMAVLALFVCAGVLCIGKLEYAEFEAVRRFFRDDSFRRSVCGHVAVRQFEAVVSEARTPQECWRAIENTSRILGIHRAEMRMGGATFRYHVTSTAMRAWQIYVPISELDWVEFYQDPGPSGNHATAMIAFAETVRRLLSSRSFISPRPAGHGVRISSSIVTQESLARAAAGSQQSN
ncbi:MAG TPA: MraY family glycosyltransferase [Bryobacteraceae bacterium]|jgi:UDP-GlcNAc:undecaprenyl-phosphate GlcNAc-1-phosphate transferase|nr:MraY family glycosyltransferase [Bryobacteraceae bacterium]